MEHRKTRASVHGGRTVYGASSERASRVPCRIRSTDQADYPRTLVPHASRRLRPCHRLSACGAVRKGTGLDDDVFLRPAVALRQRRLVRRRVSRGGRLRLVADGGGARRGAFEGEWGDPGEWRRVPPGSVEGVRDGGPRGLQHVTSLKSPPRVCQTVTAGPTLLQATWP